MAFIVSCRQSRRSLLIAIVVLLLLSAPLFVEVEDCSIVAPAGQYLADLVEKNPVVMYEKGIGVRRDLEEAVRWYEKGVARGDEKSRARLQKLKHR